jgi:hypothetical protein
MCRNGSGNMSFEALFRFDIFERPLSRLLALRIGVCF